jgi:hypothetical protein
MDNDVADLLARVILGCVSMLVLMVGAWMVAGWGGVVLAVGATLWLGNALRNRR